MIFIEIFDQLFGELARTVHSGHFVLPAQLAHGLHPVAEGLRAGFDHLWSRDADTLGPVGLIVGIAAAKLGIA